MNQYKWKVTLMDVVPSLDGFTNVVVGVHWYAEAIDESAPDPVNASIIGCTKLGKPTSQDFTAYDQLSEATVLSWVWDMDNTKQSTEQTLDNLIAKKKAPQIVNLVPPWPMFGTNQPKSE